MLVPPSEMAARGFVRFGVTIPKDSPLHRELVDTLNECTREIWEDFVFKCGKLPKDDPEGWLKYLKARTRGRPCPGDHPADEVCVFCKGERNP